MSTKIITLNDINNWLDDLDDSLQCSIMNTARTDKEGREDLYFLYQAAQLLRARMLEDFSNEVEFTHNMYDEEN